MKQNFKIFEFFVAEQETKDVTYSVLHVWIHLPEKPNFRNQNVFDVTCEGLTYVPLEIKNMKRDRVDLQLKNYDDMPFTNMSVDPGRHDNSSITHESVSSSTGTYDHDDCIARQLEDVGISKCAIQPYTPRQMLIVDFIKDETRYTTIVLKTNGSLTCLTPCEGIILKLDKGGNIISTSCQIHKIYELRFPPAHSEVIELLEKCTDDSILRVQKVLAKMQKERGNTEEKFAALTAHKPHVELELLKRAGFVIPSNGMLLFDHEKGALLQDILTQTNIAVLTMNYRKRKREVACLGDDDSQDDSDRTETE